MNRYWTENNSRRVLPSLVSIINSRSCISCACCLLLLLLTATGIPQSGGPYEIKKSVISNGGGVSTGGPYTVDSTIGEPVAGTLSAGANYQLIAGYRAGGGAVPEMHRAPFDFDGDGKTDISTWRPDPTAALSGGSLEDIAAQWWILNSSTLLGNGYQWGFSTDIAIPADFTGDGKTDIAVYRPSTSWWYIVISEDPTTFFGFPFGKPGDIPAPGDFDGDGKADPTVYRPSEGMWITYRTATQDFTWTRFGIDGDKPTVADFDGDGKDDVALYRPSLGQWWQLRSQDGVAVYQWGVPGEERTVVGDWTGDGKADIAVYNTTTSFWRIVISEAPSTFFGFPFGQPGDIPVPGDYDGDGITDPAVFKPAQFMWLYYGSTVGETWIPFGKPTDTPIPSLVSVQ